MDFKVLIAESAIADLKEIVEFVAQDDSDAAINLGNKLIARALSLRTMPQRFPFHDQQRWIRKMPLPPFLNLLHLRRSRRCRKYPALLARRSSIAAVLNGSRFLPLCRRAPL